MSEAAPADTRCMAGSITGLGGPPNGEDPLDTDNEGALPGWPLPRKPLEGCGLELWKRMLTGAQIEPPTYECDPYEEVLPSPALESRSARFPRTALRFTRAAFQPASRTQRSRNWSGLWLVPRRARRFAAVWGAWTVPHAPEPKQGEVVPPAEGQPRPPDFARCSHWVGIGGHRGHSKSLPQVGTMTAIDWDGAVRHYAWYQWWEKTRRYGPLRITNLDVNAGDRIIAAVTVEGCDKVRLHIRNEGTLDAPRHELRSIEWQADASSTTPANSATGEELMPVRVDGKSAEWVVERPSWFDRNEKPRPFRLPRFESLHFDCCHAEVAEAIGAPAAARDFRGARLVRMVGRREGVPGSRFLAIPKKQRPNRLDVEMRNP